MSSQEQNAKSYPVLLQILPLLILVFCLTAIIFVPEISTLMLALSGVLCALTYYYQYTFIKLYNPKVAKRQIILLSVFIIAIFSTTLLTYLFESPEYKELYLAKEKILIDTLLINVKAVGIVFYLIVLSNVVYLYNPVSNLLNKLGIFLYFILWIAVAIITYIVNALLSIILSPSE